MFDNISSHGITKVVQPLAEGSMSLILPFDEQKPPRPTFSDPDLQARYEQALVLTHGRKDQVDFAVEVVLYGYGGMPRIPKSQHRNLVAEKLSCKLRSVFAHRRQEARDFEQLLIKVVGKS
jgi:hypothetical protein